MEGKLDLAVLGYVVMSRVVIEENNAVQQKRVEAWLVACVQEQPMLPASLQ
jgi:hypothetical protein